MIKMVLSLTGINRTRDLISTDLNDGRAGTDTTAAAESDTDLNTPVVATESDVTKVTGTKTLSITHTIASTAANGNDLTEWQIRMNSEAIQLNRIVTAAVSKTSSIEINHIQVLYLEPL